MNRGSIRLRGSRHAVSVAAAIAGFLALAPASASAQAYSYTGSEQIYIVPAGTTLVHVVANGAPGGAGASGPESMGAVVSADVPIPQGQGVLYVEVGGTGVGFNGGGLSNGGDASDVRLISRDVPGSIGARVIVAGGGGGGGLFPGGNAGANGGGDMAAGLAGTSTAGGLGGFGDPAFECADGGAGSLGFGGDGGVADFFSPDAPFGGGGGGYYGGGGGGGFGGCFFPSSYASGFGGGGGGSSYVTPQAMNATVGLDSTRTPGVTIAPVTAATAVTSVTSPPAGVALSALSVGPRTFALAGRSVGGHCVALSTRNRKAADCRRPLSLRISYTLSAPATVSFALEQTLSGRKVHGRCTAATHGDRHAPTCSRTVSVSGSLTQIGVKGRNTLVFKGRIGGKSLTPGSYRLIATVPGNPGTGPAGTATFRLLP